jgi:hypothetical protein
MKGDWGDGWSGFPDGGIDARKYAAIIVALGRARGMLHDALHDTMDVEGVRETLYRTSLAAIAKALGLKESDLAIDWEDYLTHEELELLKVAPVPPDF